MPTIDVGSPRVIITYTVLAENLSQARHLLSGLGAWIIECEEAAATLATRSQACLRIDQGLHSTSHNSQTITLCAGPEFNHGARRERSFCLILAGGKPCPRMIHRVGRYPNSPFLGTRCRCPALSPASLSGSARC